MNDYAALHERADRAGRAAPDAPGMSRIVILKPTGNFARWIRNNSIPLIRPTGYARAYVKVVQQAGELVRIVKERDEDSELGDPRQGDR